MAAALAGALMGITLGGCQGAGVQAWGRAPEARDSGEAWAILCLEAGGERGREVVESYAEALRRTRGIRAEEVRVVYGEGDEPHRLLYGRYHKRRDPQTGELHFGEDLRRDIEFIRSLMLGAYAPFRLAVPVPLAVPSPGPPEWDVRNAPGAYTLVIGAYGDFPERREAAVEAVRALRELGEEAYYLHGPNQSHVFVGSFPENVVRRAPGQAMPVIDDPEYRRLREKYPYFAYNGRTVTHVTRDSLGRVISEQRQQSMLVKIPRETTWSPPGGQP